MGIIKYTTYDYLTPDETTLTVEYRITPARYKPKILHFHRNDPDFEDFNDSIEFGAIRDEEGKNIAALIPQAWKDAIEDEIWEAYKSEVE